MEKVRVSSPQLQPRAPHLIHTSYYKTFFLLRTKISINGELAQVGVDERGWLTLNSRDQEVSVTFDSLVTDVNDVLQQHGLHGVSNYWCEEVPLFELRGTSKGELEKLLGFEGGIWEKLASKINKRMKTRPRDQEPEASAPSDRNLCVVVEPQLYLIVPDYENMDGKPILVTRGNFSECLTLFGESNVFDFGAIFRTQFNQETEDTGPASLAILHAELYNVVNWYELGLALLVPDTELQIIRQDNPHNTVMCRSAMLTWWWKNTDTPTWSTLVQALSKSGLYKLGKRIADHYGIPPPQRKRVSTPTAPTLQEEHSNNMDVIATLSGIIAELKSDRDKRMRELAKRDHSLQEAEKEKQRAARQIETLKHKLSKCQAKIKQLRREKDDMKEALRFTQFELNSLNETATKEKEDIELKRQILDKKERKISELKQKLEAVEKELEEINLQIPALKENLQWVEVELEKKSEKVEEMQEYVNDLRLLLDMNHKILGDYLMQHTAANTSRDRYRQEVKFQSMNLKETSDMSIREYEAFHELLKIDNPQLKTLFHLLKTQPHKSTESSSPPATHLTTPTPSPRPSRSPSPPAGATITDQQAELNQTLRRALSRGSSQQSIEEQTHTVGELGSALSCLLWEKKCMAPQAMVRGAAAVYCQTVYVMGENCSRIHRYSFRNDEWSTLSVPCPHVNSGLVFVKNVLTAVGGQLSGQTTAKLTSFKNRQWTNELLPMKHPHYSPSVQNHSGNYVIVAAGSWDTEISMVEVYSIHTGHWFSVIPLPRPFYSITTTLCDNQYVVMDGGGTTYSMDVTSLVSFATNSHHEWKSQPVLAVHGEPTLTTFNRNVICVSSKGLHRLCEGKGWVKVNTFCSLWSKSVVCIIGKEDPALGEKLVVIGGYSPSSNYTTTSEVSIAH